MLLKVEKFIGIIIIWFIILLVGILKLIFCVINGF